MANIQQLNLTMINGSTVLDKDFFGAIQSKINEIINVVNNQSQSGGGTSGGGSSTPATPNYIQFADANVLQVILTKTDWSNDGKGLTFEEAASVTSLGDVFSENTAITSFNELQYFTGVTVLSNKEFINCTSLREISLPQNIDTITSGTSSSYNGGTGGCFKGCTSLTKVDATNLSKMGAYAFDGCTSLTNLIVSNKLETILGRALRYVPTIPVLPEGLKKADQYAFYGCKNTSIELPSTIETIGTSAFAYCTNLTSITVKATTPPTLGTNAFSNTSKIAHIYVPAASVDAYKSASVWSTFASMISAIS